MKEFITGSVEDEKIPKKKEVPGIDRCIALTGDGERCTRRNLSAQEKGESRFCLIHSTKNHGTVDDVTRDKPKKAKKSSSYAGSKVLSNIVSDVINDELDVQTPSIELGKTTAIDVTRVIHEGKMYLLDKSRNLLLENKTDNPKVIGWLVDGEIQPIK